MGIMAIEDALAAAENEGLDLVEVAPSARPPVVRIMDYGKFKYVEEARKARAAKKKQPDPDQGSEVCRDRAARFEFKIRHARRFLEEGNN
jgi:translation initiation factor IF-3